MAPVGPRSGDAIFSSIDRVVSLDFKVFSFFSLFLFDFLIASDFIEFGI